MSLFGLIAFIGAPLWFLYTFLAEHKEHSDLSGSVTLRHILNNKGFTSCAYSPSAAKELEADMREQLTQLKHFLMASATVSEPQSYEL